MMRRKIAGGGVLAGFLTAVALLAVPAGVSAGDPGGLSGPEIIDYTEQG